jgi:hypothetical protein
MRGLSDQDWIEKYNFGITMRPDYPHKTYSDKRICYCLLMEALAMDAG